MVTRLPVVTYEHKKWFFDQGLRQIRNVKNPHEWIDLNEFEMDYFREKVRKGDVKTFPSLINWLPRQLGNYATQEVRLSVDGRVAQLTGILAPYPATSRNIIAEQQYSRNRPRILNMLILQHFKGWI